MSTDLAVADTRIETKGQALLAHAQSLKIETREAYQAVALWVQEAVRPLKEEIRATFRPRIKQANQLHSDLIATERRFLQPVEETERLAGAALEAFDRADRDRIEEERRRLEALRHKADDDARLQAALSAEQKGESALARVLLEVPQPVFVPPPPEPVKVKGLSYREEWDFEVVELALVPRDYLAIDATKVRGVVRALKAETKIPGIRPVMSRTPVIRRGR